MYDNANTPPHHSRTTTSTLCKPRTSATCIKGPEQQFCCSKIPFINNVSPVVSTVVLLVVFSYMFSFYEYNLLFFSCLILLLRNFYLLGSPFCDASLSFLSALNYLTLLFIAFLTFLSFLILER